MQRPKIEQWVARERRRHPGTGPDEISRRLERLYLATVIGAGAATGATAVAPVVGTGVAVALAAGHAAATVEATILLGESGPRFVDGAAKRVGKHWAKNIVNAIPLSQIQRINRVLGPRFVTR